jgi:hypothetical protein
MMTSGVAVEKLDIYKNSMILGDGKWSDAPYKSFIGHPDATLFWPSFRSRVFQQPQAESLVELHYERSWVLCGSSATRQ